MVLDISDDEVGTPITVIVEGVPIFALGQSVSECIGQWPLLMWTLRAVIAARCKCNLLHSFIAQSAPYTHLH